jgi:hypothetical protein
MCDGLRVRMCGDGLHVPVTPAPALTAWKARLVAAHALSLSYACVVRTIAKIISRTCIRIVGDSRM